MKLTKVQIVSVLIGLGAILDSAHLMLSENASLLHELGISPKIAAIIRFIGLIWAIFSTSLLRNKSKDNEVKMFSDTPELPPEDPNEGIGGSNPPPKKDEK